MRNGNREIVFIGSNSANLVVTLARDYIMSLRNNSAIVNLEQGLPNLLTL